MNASVNKAGNNGARPAESQRQNISRKDLPLHCPLPSMSLWNSHPRVYLPIETTGQAQCPYCGTVYVLKD
ncbi:MAG: zinc-finger domain-containing protein [Gammaproteobacteria bacterium]